MIILSHSSIRKVLVGVVYLHNQFLMDTAATMSQACFGQWSMIQHSTTKIGIQHNRLLDPHHHILVRMVLTASFIHGSL